jgi:hypothetical protein
LVEIPSVIPARILPTGIEISVKNPPVMSHAPALSTYSKDNEILARACPQINRPQAHLLWHKQDKE